MNSKELLFNLIKKLESREIRFLFIDGDKKECVFKATGIKAVRIGEVEEIGSSKTLFARSEGYDINWNEEFKENFYQEKGLDKCWTKDCPNKIYQSKNDYKKVKIPCQEAHTRMICLNCYEKTYGK